MVSFLKFEVLLFHSALDFNFFFKVTAQVSFSLSLSLSVALIEFV